MPTLYDLLRTRKPNKEKPLDVAHYLEPHWVMEGKEWDEAARTLASLFPKQTRSERPMRWYALLRDTHWVGTCPPGNGPFYIPPWAILAHVEDMMRERPSRDEAKVRKNFEEVIKKAGFKEVIAHAAYIPHEPGTDRYLRVALRVADSYAWNVAPHHPMRVYIYPKDKKAAKAPLRQYTSEPWAPKAGD